MEMNLNNKGLYNGEERQCSMEQFIGIFPNAINDDMCSRFVKWFDEIKNWDLKFIISIHCLNMSMMIMKL